MTSPNNELDGQIEKPDACKVTTFALFTAWFLIGLNSFGGGQSTLSLIRRKLAAQNAWITDADFAQANAMAQLAPGINLLAITILIGQQLGGALGIAVSLLGLLVPSVAMTVLMTAGYAHIRSQPIVLHAFHGVVPATVGVGTLTGLVLLFAFMKPPGERTSVIETLTCVLIVGGSFILVQMQAPVIAVMLGGGILLGIVHSLIVRITAISDSKGAVE